MKKLTIGILAHVDAGKTTLSEGLLYAAGALRTLGRVDHGDAFLDTEALERERGITIFAKQAVLDCGGTHITLLDTPGHVDFSAEAERTLQVLDYAILVISGTDGVQGHTRTLWRLLERYGVPTFLFINKMDLAGADRAALLTDLQKSFGACVDLGAEPNERDEHAALTDEAALEELLERGALSDDTLAALISARKIFPCCFGSALKNEGVEEFLQLLTRFTREPARGADFGARVFKISRDAQGTRLTHLKVTGGTLRAKMQLPCGKADQLRLYSGAKFRPLDAAGAGEVVAVTGLADTYPGQGLGAEADGEKPVLQSVLTYRILLPDGTDAHTVLPKLRELELEPLYYDVELPLCAVLARMEQRGFLIDRAALAQFGETLQTSITQLEQQIYAAAGAPFNINSPKQLGKVLFEDMHLPHGKKTKTGWSTNADVLDKLRGVPIVADVLQYRQYAKLKSTYADGLLKAVSPDGRIRTSFQMTVTATGRLSSTEPNLQNIPTRTELGSQMRRMFVAAPGNVLVDADYSQIELRLLAHISGDEAMCRAFRSGEDFHTLTAARVFHVEPQDVTPEMRRRAKAVNFGVVYGISPFSLSQDIGVTVAEAKEYMERYFQTYTGVRAYMDRIVEQARADGYVETLMHRRRALPELKSSNHNLRAFGERVALNMPIQGTAADLMKLAMVRVERRLADEGLAAQIIMQVHDELIVECPVKEAEQVKKIVTAEMENVVQLKVPLLAEAKSGASWYEAK